MVLNRSAISTGIALAVFGAIAFSTSALQDTTTPAVVEAGAPTPTPEYNQGDVNCSRVSGQPGGVNSVDALAILRYNAALAPTPQNEPCPDIGTGSGGGFGDVDCGGGIDSVDALKVLRHSAGLSVSQTQPCTPMGLWPASGT